MLVKTFAKMISPLRPRDTETPPRGQIHYNRDVTILRFIHTKTNTLRPRQNCQQFADGIFKYIFLKENVLIPIRISLTFVPRSLVDNNSELVQVMAWRREGDKPLSEVMTITLPTYICVTRPYWVKDKMTGRHQLYQGSNSAVATRGGFKMVQRNDLCLEIRNVPITWTIDKFI